MKVFKRKIVRYVDSSGTRCSSSTPGVRKLVEWSSNYYGWVNGKAVALCPDKGAATTMLVRLLSEAKLEEVGVRDPYKEHRDRPLKDHLGDFVRYLEHKKLDGAYVRKTRANCLKAIESCAFKKMDDIRESKLLGLLSTLRNPTAMPKLSKETYTTQEVASLIRRSVRHVLRLNREGQLPSCGKAPGSGPRKLFHRDALQAFLSKHRPGIGPVTANHILASMKRFTRWLVRDHRSDKDSLASLELFNEAVDRRHRRRALPADQFERFVNAAFQGEPYRALSGHDRHVLYLTAAYTGLRAGELSSLTPTSFDLDAKQPVVVVDAKVSKHREEDRQPLHPDLVKVLRRFLEGKGSTDKLWPGLWVENAAEMIRIDLARANIPYRDDSGRFFDFHSLRALFVTRLVQAGAEPKNTQKLARHKNITLTLDCYTDGELLQSAAELSKLPPINSPLLDGGEGLAG